MSLFRSYIFLFFVLLSLPSYAKNEVKEIRLWEKTPHLYGARMLCYQAPPDKNTGASVIIFPGGSYHHLGRKHEGRMVAEWFNKQGISAFVVFYRTAGRGFHHPAMIEDFQRSIQLVRENAGHYNIDSQKVGAIGFSAGGHLACMGGAFSHENYLEKRNISSTVSLRPDWLALIYPVVSMQDSIAHKRSRKSLLGLTFDQEDKDRFSMEMQIPEDMPPVFLLASKDDPTVNHRNSILLDEALSRKNIPHTFLLFESGGHGYGMKETEFSRQSHWKDDLYKWLTIINII